MVTKANIIVGTTNNNAAICMSLKKAAQGLIEAGKETDQGVLNMIEMAFRAYDPCFSCATHRLPGDMPMQVRFHDNDGNTIRIVKRD
jgi:F420-non-reducing hydrogenase large subunit